MTVGYRFRLELTPLLGACIALAMLFAPGWIHSSGAAVSFSQEAVVVSVALPTFGEAFTRQERDIDRVGHYETHRYTATWLAGLLYAAAFLTATTIVWSLRPALERPRLSASASPSVARAPPATAALTF